MIDLIKEAAFYICFFLFIIGLLCTVTSGSLKTLKICISLFSLFFFILSVIALVVSQGLVIFLIPQLITLVIVFIIVISAGAALGYWIHTKFVKGSSNKKISQQDLNHYISVEKFALAKGLEEDKVLKRVKSGFYQGGRASGCWYVHKSELSL